jgi:hypothetical protein
MNDQRPNALKDPEHRKNVAIAILSIVLMVFCFTMCNFIMDQHWETRYQIGFLVAGVCYLTTPLCMATDKGFHEG